MHLSMSNRSEMLSEWSIRGTEYLVEILWLKYGPGVLFIEEVLIRSNMKCEVNKER